MKLYQYTFDQYARTLILAGLRATRDDYKNVLCPEYRREFPGNVSGLETIVREIDQVILEVNKLEPIA